jgi:glycosyltransferase involved in cell wall biosynthesis
MGGAPETCRGGTRTAAAAGDYLVAPPADTRSVRETVAKNVRHERLRAKLSESELARVSGVDRETIAAASVSIPRASSAAGGSGMRDESR